MNKSFLGHDNKADFSRFFYSCRTNFHFTMVLIYTLTTACDNIIFLGDRV